MSEPRPPMFSADHAAHLLGVGTVAGLIAAGHLRATPGATPRAVRIDPAELLRFCREEPDHQVDVLAVVHERQLPGSRTPCQSVCRLIITALSSR